MSYRTGIGGALAMMLRVEPTEAHIVCDGCGIKRSVYANKKSYSPAKWLLDRRPAPGWELVRVADTRGWDYCPACKARRAAQEIEP